MEEAVDRAKAFVGQGQARSVRAKKNILASLVIKAGNIVISLLLIPMTIDYVNPSRYGIWLTLSSIVAWFSFFDIGLTSGLRNKFSEAKAQGDNEKARVYVSTTFATLGIVFSALWGVFAIANRYLDWSKILNVSAAMNAEITTLALIVVTYFCLQFVFRVITTILTADQKPASSSLVDGLGQFVCLVVILVLTKSTQGSLVNLGLALCVSPIVVLVGANLFLFSGSYRAYRPSLSKVDFSLSKGLFNLGFMFFTIQIAGIVQYESANLIISRYFGPTDVTDYNIVFKYFGVLNMMFSIFLVPFWSASTEAYISNDIAWIKNGMKKYSLLTIGLLLVGIIMLIFSNDIYDLWLGEGKVNIPFSLSLWGLLFFCVTIFSAKYLSFLNGISALRLQFYACFLSPVLYIVLTIYFIKYLEMGVYAIFVAAIVSNFNGLILAPIQYYQIVYNNKKGIWVK